MTCRFVGRSSRARLVLTLRRTLYKSLAAHTRQGYIRIAKTVNKGAVT